MFEHSYLLEMMRNEVSDAISGLVPRLMPVIRCGGSPDSAGVTIFMGLGRKAAGRVTTSLAPDGGHRLC